MSKKPGALFSSLRAKLLLVMILGVLCSFAAYIGMNAMGNRLIDRYYLSPKAVYTRNRANIEEFQSYIQSNNLSLRDTDAISRWTIAKQDVYILLYQNERLALEAGWWGIDKQLSGEEKLENVGSDMIWPVVFRDGQVQAVVYDYSQSRLYDLVTLVSIVAACAVFALILLNFNGRITKAIINVSKQVQRIGEGNLQLQLEPKGTDELALLTASVEQMRLSILHKTAEEQKALEQNSELITAMSHDIRNPLTALIGYLDLICNQQYRTQEELDMFLQAGYDKALQLKTLTDELFRYSLLFGNKEIAMQPETFDAQILLGQMLGERSVGLQQRGFDVRMVLPETGCTVCVDVTCFSRVLDNLFDNVRKYAEHSEPVSIMVLSQPDGLHICISNTIRQLTERVESNGIGLRTTQKILTQMGGSFRMYTEQDKYTAEAVIPTEKK